MSPFKKHFRIYLISRHPAYIVDEKDGYYYFHRVTSSPKSGHHKNWKVDPNPDNTRTTPMYIVKAEQKDKKARFGKKLKYNIDISFVKKKKDQPSRYSYSSQGSLTSAIANLIQPFPLIGLIYIYQLTGNGRFGGSDEDRTRYLLHAMEALSQVSYGPITAQLLYIK